MCVTLMAVVLAGATLLWPVGVVAASGSEVPEEALEQALEQAPLEEVAGVMVEPDVPALIVEAAGRWGLAPERMLRIAWCESRWDPGARSGAGHAGLFQFAWTTWQWASVQAGYGGASPYDAAANVESAAWLMATDGFHHWGCR